MKGKVSVSAALTQRESSRTNRLRVNDIICRHKIPRHALIRFFLNAEAKSRDNYPCRTQGIWISITRFPNKRTHLNARVHFHRVNPSWHFKVKCVICLKISSALIYN